MRDLMFLGIVGAAMLCGLKRPFLFVLLYVYIDIVAPSKLTYGFMTSIPLSAMTVALAVAAWAAVDDKTGVRFTVRQALLAGLLAYCWWTTANADFPVEAKEKWDWAWKAMAFGVFLPLTLRTKLRIEALVLTMVLALSALIVTGGIKTAVGGGGYGVMQILVDDNSGLYEGSIISTTAISMIPIILWLTRHGTIFPPEWRVTLYGWALCGACVLIPIGTQARTGLVCAAVAALLIIRDAKRKMLWIGGIAFLGIAALPFLPSAFTERMNTIGSYQADASASTRVEVWKWTLGYVQANPMGGGFDAFRQNSIRYDTVTVEGAETGNARVVRRLEIDKGRAYHSSYFEMLGEQGYPGFLMWITINAIGLIRMEVLRRRYRTGDDAWAGGLASALQHALLIYLIGSVFVGIAFQPVLYMLLGAGIGLDTFMTRRRRAQLWTPFSAANAARPVAQTVPAG